MILGIGLLLAAALAVAVFALAGGKTNVADRLAAIDASAGLEQSEKHSLFRRLMDEQDRHAMSRKLQEAGWYNLTPQNVLMYRLFGLLGGSVFGLLMLFVFHRNDEEGRVWRPKVLPPRSRTRRGVFATRAPHRPNPIGMSVVRLVAVEGLTLRVRGLDLLDGTPVLDVKPYVSYADAHPDAGAGWLEARDPVEPWTIVFEPRADAQLSWLAARQVDLRRAIQERLELGPEPHPYRRIRVSGDERILALREWRAVFRSDGRTLSVAELRSGYRREQCGRGICYRSHRTVPRSEAPLLQ